MEEANLPFDIILENGVFNNVPAEDELSAVESSIYNGSSYSKLLSGLSLSGDFRNSVISIALSQVGYHEGDSEKDFDGGNESGTGDYTDNGRYMQSLGTARCSEFSSWCVRMSGLPKVFLVMCKK